MSKNLTYKFIVENKLNIKFLTAILLLLIAISSISSLNSNEIYELKWYYLSTPVGLIDATLFTEDEELQYYYSYLKTVETQKETSLIAVILATIGVIFSNSYLIFTKKRLEVNN